MKYLQHLMLTASVVAIACGTPAMAQSEPQSHDNGLETIVVTAQRKSEDVQKAAIAINVVSSNELVTSGATDTTVLNKVAPSLFVSKGAGALTSFFIRGVGNFTNNSLADPAVAFNYDGVYIARPAASVTSFFDLDRIEVLKGPQGTLYGRNATGGAVNVIPSRPKLGELSASGSVGYGNYNAWDLEASANAPLGENAAVRVSGRLADSDGYNADGTDDTKAEAIRGQLYLKSGDFNVRVSADYSHLGGLGPGGNFDGRLQYAPGAPASATAPANYVFIPSGLADRRGLLSPSARAYFSTLVNVAAFNFPGPIDSPFIDNENWGVHAEANLTTTIGTFTLIPAYRQANINQRFSGPAFRAGWSVETGKQTSVELRLDGQRIGPVEWLIGGMYFDETVDANSTFNQYLVENIQDFNVKNKAWAGFGRITFHVSDQVRLTGGLRYTKDDKSVQASTIAVLNQCTIPIVPPNFVPCAGGPSLPSALTLADLAAAIPASQLPVGFPAAPFAAVPFGTNGNIILYAPGSQSSNFNKGQVTYRLAAEADVFENSLAYISYETGYRSGGFNLTFGRETYSPEYLRALTVGLKNKFFDNKVLLNIEAFHWSYRDQQLAHLGLDGRGNASYFTENIGRSRIWGVDVDAAVQASRNTLLTAGVQYLNAETLSFTYTVPDTNNLGIPPATSCPSVDSGAVFTVDCAGKSLINAPKWSINTGIEQTFELGEFKLVFNGGARYRSNRVTGFDYVPQQNSGGTFEADASLRFAQVDDRWSITAWVRNLTNAQIPTVNQYNSSTGGVLTTVYQPPRTYGVRAAFKF